MSKTLAWALVLVAALFPRLVQAETRFPGADAVDYREAVSLWLDGNDAESLPALARLASEGNDAARLLLPHIEILPRVGSVFLEGMTRAESRALFRAPGGLSGTSWLKVLADESDFAALLLASRGPRDQAKHAAALLAEGERLAANALVLRATMAGARNDVFTLAETNQLSREVRHAAWHSAMAVLRDNDGGARERGLVEEALAEARSGDIASMLFIGTYLNDPITVSDPAAAAEIHAFFKLLVSDPRFPPTNVSPEIMTRFESALATYSPYQSIAGPCETLCPTEPRACMRAAYAGLGGHDSVVVFGSPLERLLPREDYATSRRGAIHLLQTLAPFHETGFMEGLRSTSSCLVSAIEDLRF